MGEAETSKPSVETTSISTPIGRLFVELRGSGPAIVCWPSLYCDARTLDPLLEDLERDHRVLVVEGPGHGRSGPSPRRFSLSDCADAAVHVLDELGVDRAVWVGAAWGGQVGVMAARRHAQRLSGLILLNAPMSTWTGKHRALVLLAYALLRVFGPDSFVASLIADSMIAKTVARRSALVERVAAALRRCERHGLILAVRSAMLEREDLGPLLPGVRVPTVFFAGADDALFPVDVARRQAGAIPECRFEVVEHSAHQSALENPEQVLPVLRQALAAWASGDAPPTMHGSVSESRSLAGEAAASRS